MATRLLNKLLPIGALLLPLAARAQTPADMARILERLDRLEQENRRLSDQVRDLTERLSSASPAPVPASETPPKLSADDRLDIVERRVEEQAQTKVEALQKFPVRLAGMA